MAITAPPSPAAPSAHPLPLATQSRLLPIAPTPNFKPLETSIRYDRAPASFTSGPRPLKNAPAVGPEWRREGAAVAGAMAGFPHGKLNLVELFHRSSKDEGAQQKDALREDGGLRRRFVLFCIASSGFSPTLSSHGKTKSVKNPYDEKRLLEQNRRIQRENNVPEDFPSFIREGFEVKVVTSENYVRKGSGLIYRDFQVGTGDCPLAGQQVTFHYIGYNESGRRIDSTYLQGSPAKIRMGTNALVPGFEEGIRDMRPGGKRRIVIPPELGPPGPRSVLPWRTHCLSTQFYIMN